MRSSLRGQRQLDPDQTLTLVHKKRGYLWLGQTCLTKALYPRWEEIAKTIQSIRTLTKLLPFLFQRRPLWWHHHLRQPLKHFPVRLGLRSKLSVKWTGLKVKLTNILVHEATPSSPLRHVPSTTQQRHPIFESTTLPFLQSKELDDDIIQVDGDSGDTTTVRANLFSSSSGGGKQYSIFNVDPLISSGSNSWQDECDKSSTFFDSGTIEH